MVLAFAPNVEEQIEALMRLPGIGPWTAQYIAMRALHWPDAFPERRSDADASGERHARRQLEKRVAGWRPWRAYATHYLWQSLGVNP